MLEEASHRGSSGLLLSFLSLKHRSAPSQPCWEKWFALYSPTAPHSGAFEGFSLCSHCLISLITAIHVINPALLCQGQVSSHSHPKAVLFTSPLSLPMIFLPSAFKPISFSAQNQPGIKINPPLRPFSPGWSLGSLPTQIILGFCDPSSIKHSRIL